MKAALLASTSIFSILSNGYLLRPPDQLIERPLSLPSPLQSILDDIDRCIDAKLYYPAIAVSLTLPDICMGLALQDNAFVTSKTYAEFIDTYAPNDPPNLPYIGMEGASCYQLRCGVVHRGNAAGSPFFGATHVIFSTPDTDGGMHAISIVVDDKTAVMVDVEIFVSAMKEAVRNWYRKNASDATAKANLPRLLSTRPMGVPPFYVGTPLVASGL